MNGLCLCWYILEELKEMVKLRGMMRLRVREGEIVC